MTRQKSILAALFAFIGLSLFGLAFAPRSLFAVAPITPALDYTFPAGTSYLTAPLKYEGQNGITIRGQRDAAGVSRVVYRGPATVGAIQFIGCTRAKLLDVEIVIESAGVDAAVLLTNSVNPPQQGYSTGCEVNNVRVMHSGTWTAAKRAFSVDSFAAGGQDGNNDHHHFEDCYAQSYSEAGFRINGSQCHDIAFTRCAAHDAGGRNPIGLHSVSGVHFEWRRGASNSNAVDFKLGTPEIQAVIEGHNSENATQFLTANFNGECFVRIADVRWDGKPGTRPVIEATGPGPWSITNSYFAGTNGVIPRFVFAGPQPGSLDLAGVMLRQHGGTQPTQILVTATRGWELRQHGLWWQRVGGAGPSKKMIYVNKPMP